VATTSTTTCATGPTTLDTAPGAGGGIGNHPFEQPRFSPNGERVVYAKNGENNHFAHIATVGFDGSAAHLVAPYGAAPDAAADPDAGLGFSSAGPRPVWLNDTTVAWLQQLDSANWQIVSAPDQEGATATLLMSCTGEVPSQFDVLPSGEVIVSQATGTNNDKVVQIQAYPVTAGTKVCGSPRNISKLSSTSGGSRAWDFSLSPNGKTSVAYLAYDDVSGLTDVRVAAVDGSSAPTSAGGIGGASGGPRWVGGGAFLSWGADGTQFDAGISGTSVAVAKASGGTARSAVSAPAGDGTHTIGNGYFSCGFAPAVGSGVSLFGIAGILGLRVARRRRR
jgi:hypothetical protein